MVPLQRSITVLGSTGSIGRSTLDVVARHPERYRIFALAAQRQWELMLEQCRVFRPRYAALLEPEAAESLARAVRQEGLPCEVLGGEASLVAVAQAPEADTVLAAIVGAAGLMPTLAAARAGKRVLLANKETLVLAGGLFMRAAAESGATVLPIDSEHNAIFQCLPADYAQGKSRAGVRRIVLTASGGPFRELPLEELIEVSPDQACAHPNWVMGRKISVDSATMMNKGLEVIEAHWLFGLPAERIDVVIHPQSVIHSLVEYLDGSLLAQLSNPDMRTPIAHALAYPERVNAGVEALELTRIAALQFYAPDLLRFPCLRLAYDALKAGGSAAAMLNAANEVAVAAFLADRARFPQIAATCAQVLESLPTTELDSLDAALAADAAARREARRCLRLDEAA
ncbi:MAG: 1-deoxy-D-xylulose-5-phosphate reductoisomerase [Betaproteobacteria bacterium]|nr:1-deoxy-D-xylulose-5-phosphate reductoisomerase [Betaproteobacteria bacterium]